MSCLPTSTAAALPPTARLLSGKAGAQELHSGGLGRLAPRLLPAGRWGSLEMTETKAWDAAWKTLVSLRRAGKWQGWSEGDVK